jgi:hypothetical protein
VTTGSLGKHAHTHLPASDDVGATKVNEDKLRLSKVGKITVKVHRYSDGVRYAVDQPEIAGLRNTYDNAVNEKALKGEAKSHGISYGLPDWIPKHTLKNSCSLGAAERTTVADCMDCKRIDGSDYPIAIFTFKYRSNGDAASGPSFSMHSANFQYSGLETTSGH